MRACLGAYVLTLALACGLAQLLQRWMPDGHVWRVGPRQLDPPDEPAFLAYRGGTVDHYVYYADIGGVISGARAADILILGNSNAGLGFDPETLRQFRDETGVLIYNLCFNLNERAEFALEVLHRHNLRPAIALVNADYFFEKGMSAAGETITREGEWRALTNWAEKNMGHALGLRLHRWMPYFDWANRFTGDGLVYRSPVDGAWLVVKGPRGNHPLERPGADTVLPLTEEIQYAKTFRDELAGNGTSLVLTWVPYPGGSRNRAERLAAALGVPFLRGGGEGLRLRDHSHLTPGSAAQFTRVILDQLVDLDVMQPLPGGRTP